MVHFPLICLHAALVQIGRSHGLHRHASETGLSRDYLHAKSCVFMGGTDCSEGAGADGTVEVWVLVTCMHTIHCLPCIKALNCWWVTSRGTAAMSVV